MIKGIRNIGILAHADAGKTTLTEHFLFESGKIKVLGSVDTGTSHSDFSEVEKSRGISVRSSYTSFEWNDIQINLIDTPGHVDFSADVERSIRVMDAAVLIISASEGVQAHTETIWNALKKRHIPIIIFINKIDRLGADNQLVINEIEKELTKSIAVLQIAENEGESNAKIQSVWNENSLYEKTLENLAECNEEILELYLEGRNIKYEKANSILKQSVKKGVIIPVLAGSVKYSLGIKELLNTIIDYFPEPVQKPNESLSGLVFGISHDKIMGKIAHVRIFEGKIKNRDVILNYSRNNFDEKVTQVRKIFADSFEDIGIVSSGDIAGLCGLKNAQIGDILGSPSEYIPDDISLQAPLLTVRIIPESENDFSALAHALEELSTEDPSLNFNWFKEEKELHIRIMGELQIQILKSILENRFNIKVKFENPTVIYKETPLKTGEGFVRYWMPKPCWAILKFRIEPGERGSGVVYQSEISVDDVLQKYQNEVERTIPDALKQGIKGWEVTDIRIILTEGEDHQVHSRSGDFAIATPMGIMNGLKNIGTALLEPVLIFKISAPEELLGKIASDITQMRGHFESPEINKGTFILTGLIPLATSINYPIKLNSRSGGKAKISTQFHSWQVCQDEEGLIRKYKGISPLDTAKYILKARKAIQ